MSTLFSRILLPTDFSEPGRPAAVYACEMARQFNASLYCLHVVDDSYQYWSAMGPEPVIVGPPPQELIESARQRLQRFCAEYVRDLPRAAVESVSLGSPFVEIIGYAKEHSIDLIVMGTHGRGTIAHALLGGTTEKVVRKAPCAVLTVRACSQQFAAP
jgi:nucleotide-binding universal stress UspA family protein